VKEAALSALPDNLEQLAERIVAALSLEAARYCSPGLVPQIARAALHFTRVVDPGNQLPGYDGIWRDARQARCGRLTINCDESFYAEYDLFRPHPTDTRWFVEMVTAWGRGDTLKVEAQMIRSLEDA
jgi:hypothetical protein